MLYLSVLGVLIRNSGPFTLLYQQYRTPQDTGEKTFFEIANDKHS